MGGQSEQRSMSLMHVFFFFAFSMSNDHLFFMSCLPSQMLATLLTFYNHYCEVYVKPSVFFAGGLTSQKSEVIVLPGLH